jgi:Flp pilus assembly protein CpaB
MKSKLPLVMAITIGVLAFLAIRAYVNKMQQQAQDQLKGEPVVAARVDIRRGDEVTMQMIAPKSVPRQFIPRQALQGSGDVKLLLGRKAAVDIPKGQIILWSDLIIEAKGGLSTIIPEGQGAFTVSIGKGVKPGLIQPSDHIDILGSFAAPKPTQPLPTTTATWRQGSDMVNVVLLQNVTVLAVGEAFGSAPRPENAGGADLTLSLTLPETQLLMFAAEHGELGAVLRREGATDVKPRAELPRVTFEAIEQIIGDLDQKRMYRSLEVQQGSKSITVPVLNPK